MSSQAAFGSSDPDSIRPEVKIELTGGKRWMGLQRKPPMKLDIDIGMFKQAI